MSFILSKIAWALLTPGSLLLLALLGAWGLARSHPRWSRCLLASSILFVAALSICPLGPWILRPLETRFPMPRLEHQTVDGIIVLGGVLDPEATQITGVPVLQDTAERLTSFIALAKAYPQAKLIFSGGSGDPLRPGFREADAVKPFLEAQGLAPGRVIYERDSRNTYENAVYAKALASPKPGQHWLLVTSAWHMPRAAGCFEKIGWHVIAYPVDFNSYSDDHWGMFLPEVQFKMVTVGVKEWLGLLSYRLMNRI